MRKVLCFFALLGAFCVTSGIADASQCICAKMPMWQVSGGNWYHYAIVCETPVAPETLCQNLYPTGYVGPYATNQNCGLNCGDCAALPTRAAVPARFFYAGGIKNYGSLNDVDGVRFREALITQSQDQNQARAGYAGFDFSLPKVISFERRMGEASPVTVYAIVYKITERGSANHFGFIGLQIFQPADGVQVFPVDGRCIAAHSERENGSVTHTAIPGILRVQVNSSEIAFVRLHGGSHPEGSSGTYPACLHGRSLAGDGIGGIGAPQAVNIAGAAATSTSPCLTQCNYRRHCRRKR